MVNQTLLQIAQYLDISPTDYKKAQERFSAIKNWLDNGAYKSGYSPDVYLQGSFRLGTVVRPYHKDKEGNYDIDQVCELTKYRESKSPKILKNDIGDRLKEDNDYERMLEIEGRRCWTITYASEIGRPGFHIDILPAFKSDKGTLYTIDITHREENVYSWSSSNPKDIMYGLNQKMLILLALLKHKEEPFSMLIGNCMEERKMFLSNYLEPHYNEQFK